MRKTFSSNLIRRPFRSSEIEFLFYRLRQSQMKLKFVTNTTKESKRVLLERLTNIGFDIIADEIFTSLTAAKRLIEMRKLSPLMLVDDKALEEFEGSFISFKRQVFKFYTWSKITAEFCAISVNS